MMTADEKHAVALVRYSAISGLVAGTISSGTSQNDFYREAASKSYSMPNGSLLKVTPATIKRWYGRYEFLIFLTLAFIRCLPRFR